MSALTICIYTMTHNSPCSQNNLSGSPASHRRLCLHVTSTYMAASGWKTMFSLSKTLQRAETGILNHVKFHYINSCVPKS